MRPGEIDKLVARPFFLLLLGSVLGGGLAVALFVAGLYENFALVAPMLTALGGFAGFGLGLLIPRLRLGLEPWAQSYWRIVGAIVMLLGLVLTLPLAVARPSPHLLYTVGFFASGAPAVLLAGRSPLLEALLYALLSGLAMGVYLATRDLMMVATALFFAFAAFAAWRLGGQRKNTHN